MSEPGDLTEQELALYVGGGTVADRMAAELRRWRSGVAELVASDWPSGAVRSGLQALLGGSGPAPASDIRALVREYFAALDSWAADVATVDGHQRLHAADVALRRAVGAPADQVEAVAAAQRSPCDDRVAFADQELADDRTAAFRGHLADCASCREALVDDVQLSARLETLPPRGGR